MAPAPAFALAPPRFSRPHACPKRYPRRRSPSSAILFTRTPQLSCVTPAGICASPARAVALAAAAAGGGATLVQLRDSGADREQLLVVACAMRDALAESACELVVNGGGAAVEVARGLGVGVHLREREAVRVLEGGLIGVGGVVGVSVHSVEAAVEVLRAGAGRVGYLQVGTMFETESHPGKVPEGVRLMRDVRRAVGEGVVLLGVGGVTVGNVREVVGGDRGDGAAVISGIASAEDPEGAARELWRVVRGCF